MIMKSLGSIIVAAGQGLRAGGEIPKQFQMLLGKPLFSYSLDAFEASLSTQEIVLVVPKSWQHKILEDYPFLKKYQKLKAIVAGGASRQESSLAGLKILSPHLDLISVHDAARALIETKIIEEVAQEAFAHGAAIAASQASDTIKVTHHHSIEKTLDRSNIYLAQTPQIFRRSILEEAYKIASQQNFQGTDESSLVENLGYKVKVVNTHSHNLKITHPSDFKLAEWILKERNL